MHLPASNDLNKRFPKKKKRRFVYKYGKKTKNKKQNQKISATTTEVENLIKRISLACYNCLQK